MRKENEDIEESSNTVGWFITGAIIGATVAFLYTPKSGKETRQFIADATERG